MCKWCLSLEILKLTTMFMPRILLEDRLLDGEHFENEFGIKHKFSRYLKKRGRLSFD